MWKLMIADDEPKIRRGLRNSLNWKELNIEVVGEAEDGEIALNIAKETQPDFILLDICMPFINGLELIERVKEILPDCIIIIISGYDEFSYAQKAVKLKVFDYLLKPVSQNILKTTIETAIKELNKKVTKSKYTNWKEKNVEENISIVKENFFNRLIFNEISESEIVENLQFLKINAENLLGMFLIRRVERAYMGNALKEWNSDLLNFALKNIVEEVLKDYQCNVFVHSESGNIIAFSAICNKSEWNKAGNQIEHAVERYLKQTIIAGQRENKEGIGSVSLVYEKLLESINKETECKPLALRIKNFIKAHYFENDFGMLRVAEQFSVSPTYVSRILKAEIGYSFIDYLTNVRIENAIEIMKDPTVKICEVSELVGYSSQHYFSKAFKKITGEAPIKFREENLF